MRAHVAAVLYTRSPSLVNRRLAWTDARKCAPSTAAVQYWWLTVLNRAVATCQSIYYKSTEGEFRLWLLRRSMGEADIFQSAEGNGEL